MGAATVLMALDQKLPSNVAGIVADSPYASSKEIDIERLREDLIADSFGLSVGLGFPGMLVETDRIRNASAEEIIRIAEGQGIRIEDYRMK